MKVEDLNIRVEGEGIPILFLHGWGLNYHFMEPLFLHFKDRYKVCMLDLPGFGDSVPLPCAYHLDDYVSTIQSVIDVYGLEAPVFIAHSFGARIAFRYASKYPTRFLILCGAAGIKAKRGISYYSRVCTYKLLKKLNVRKKMGSEDYQSAQGYLKQTLVKIVNDDNHKDIVKITCPILLVWGEKDTQTPLWMAYTIQRLNKNTSLIVWKGEDHFAYHHRISQFIQVCEHVIKEVK